jgi:hypothetical protein
MIIGEKNMDLKRLTERLKLRFLIEIGRFHWNQGEEIAHFDWFSESWYIKPGSETYLTLCFRYEFIWNIFQNQIILFALILSHHIYL